MSAKVKPIPEGFRTLTPYVIVKDGCKAIEFYKKAFGAKELSRLDAPEGKVGHAELMIGDSRLLLADEFPEWNARSPKTIGDSPVYILLYVEDVDAVANRAVAEGAVLTQPVTDQFYGDRNCLMTDPFGHKWLVTTHIEDVSPEDMKKRAAALLGKG
jgi:PhnB protein